MALSLNQDGSLIAAICEDENKKYLIEVYDFDFNHPYSASCGTLYSQTTSYEKQCLSWNPKRNILAVGGEDKDASGHGGIVNLIMANTVNNDQSLMQSATK